MNFTHCYHLLLVIIIVYVLLQYSIICRLEVYNIKGNYVLFRRNPLSRESSELIAHAVITHVQQDEHQ